MELALYHETHGYYEKRSDQVGTAGDFITSVSVGDLFGRLLAFQFAEWFKKLDPSAPCFHLVEAGAHNGQLMLDVLSGLRTFAPETLEKIRCVIIEPSPRRREWQRETLSALRDRVCWCAGWNEVVEEIGPIYGVIYSNELLDAFPTRRFIWDADAGRWFELGVAAEADLLIWTRLAGDVDPGVDPDLFTHLPNGFIHETSPDAIQWWTEAAASLRSGRLLTIDYGARSEELLNPVRSNGTLRAYRDHTHVDNLLADPGEQDLTATVNWTAFQEAGERAGLASAEAVKQSSFLIRILEKAVQSHASDWQLSPKQIRQFHMLTHPEHLGRKFQALVQAKDSAQDT